ncbi:MBL fold metallo-hydrolase [Leptospira sarikeiensis]|uniref:Metallo-beta-lactamase domain-containing protein n=1 Tax=Leptospira sarikeiensis TaxID=2484943 RepID=A0A4R9K154_9LEPT|nr:MBL fold metallo-hydrolase [Leptospira sarikeiensis]TGL58861.1 hypothetical protein EHQ64_17620 [Leptospira sarikeiensis]
MYIKRRSNFTIYTITILILLSILVLFQTACLSSFGGTPSGARLERMKKSKMFHDGLFENDPFVPNLFASYGTVMNRQFFGSETRVPPSPIPVLKPDKSLFSDPVATGIRAIWFGHASVLVEIDGIRIMTDPVFAEKVSPFESLGPSRFFQPPLSLAELPNIDAVVISHDHYDHLDMETAKFLTSKGTKYFVPLGIGAHLETWGIPENQIIELDWWEKGNIKNIEIICTPAVHYSGRGLFNRKSTLWSSWSIVGPKHKFFHSGDTGYSPHFSEIGNKLGPFDLTSIKVGAYDWTWEGIHMNPESAVQAHLDLKGKAMLPVHWATFNLAIHSWEEPIVRTKEGANKNGVRLFTPKPGELVDVEKGFESEAWWEKVK